MKIKKRNKRIDKKAVSAAHKKYIKNLRNDKIFVHIMQVLVLVIFLLLWELLASTEVIDPYFFSSPSRIFKIFIDEVTKDNLFYHIGISLYETVLGFLIATAIGTVIASLLWYSEKARRILDPYIVVLNSLPKIALGPLIIIWVGSGTAAIITMCILICVVITTISMLNAFMSCDKNKILLMRSMGANKAQIFFKLIVPNAVPEFISVLKINVGMSWVGTVMGEMLSSSAGLGYLIDYGGKVLNLHLVMMCTVVLCILAALMYVIINRIEKHFKRH